MHSFLVVGARATVVLVLLGLGCGKTVDASEGTPGDHRDGSALDALPDVLADASLPPLDVASSDAASERTDGRDDEASSDASDAPTPLDAGRDAPVSCPDITGAGSALALTNSAYNHTVRDLLGDTSAPADAFIEDSVLFGFKVNPVRQLSDVSRELYAMAADQLAQAALARIGTLLPCNPASGEATCAAQFIQSFGLRAFRRPLSPAEVLDLTGVYQSARASQDFAHGIVAVIASMLKSPHFYEIEEGAPSSDLTALTPYQVASRLSYFIYRSMPDAPLFEAAAAGKLGTASEIESQARRMLADPKAHDGIVEFFAEWLSLDRLAFTSKAPSVSPDFATLRGYMRTETTKFVESVFFGTGKWTDLLRSSETWLNQPLAQLYGAPPVSGLAFQKVVLDANMRGGILTQASFLSITALPDQSSPTQRGVAVLQKLFCQEIPPPPIMIPPLPAQMAGQTNRERYEALAEAACAACHTMTDRIGFGLENFDAIGRYRVTDNGKPVDSSGTVQSTDVAGPFNGPIELSSKVTSSQDARLCAAKQWFRFALGRVESDADLCSLDRAASALASSGDLRELVVALAGSDAFRYARWVPSPAR